jgi:hypothetical protein
MLPKLDFGFAILTNQENWWGIQSLACRLMDEAIYLSLSQSLSSSLASTPSVNLTELTSLASLLSLSIAHSSKNTTPPTASVSSLSGSSAPPLIDWIPLFAKVDERMKADGAQTDSKLDLSRVPSPHSLSCLAAYAGRYVDQWYGYMEVKCERAAAGTESLSLSFLATPSLQQGSVSHWAADTFLVRWSDRSLRADALVTFALNADKSRVEKVTFSPYREECDFSFDYTDLLFRPAPAQA